MELVLASGSPRRAELLESVGWLATIVPPEVDESRLPEESATEYVLRLSAQKALTVAFDYPSSVVVAADTAVELDGEILGKPADAGQVRQMIERLSGRSHQVHTGVTVVGPESSGDIVVTTTVTFGTLSHEEVSWYVEQGESLDKAGAYALQGAGAVLVERIDGSVTNVIGLPLRETINLVRAAVLRATMPAVESVDVDPSDVGEADIDGVAGPDDNGQNDQASADDGRGVTGTADIDTYDAEDLSSRAFDEQSATATSTGEGLIGEPGVANHTASAPPISEQGPSDADRDHIDSAVSDPADRRRDRRAPRVPGGDRGRAERTDPQHPAEADSAGRGDDVGRWSGARRAPSRRRARRRNPEDQGDVVEFDASQREPLFQDRAAVVDTPAPTTSEPGQTDVTTPTSDSLTRAREYLASDDFVEADALAHADADREFVIGGPLDGTAELRATRSTQSQSRHRQRDDSERYAPSDESDPDHDDDDRYEDLVDDRDRYVDIDLHERVGDDPHSVDTRTSNHGSADSKRASDDLARTGVPEVQQRPATWSIRIRSHGRRHRTIPSFGTGAEHVDDLDERHHLVDSDGDQSSIAHDRDAPNADRSPHRYQMTTGTNRSSDVERRPDVAGREHPSGS